MTVHDDIINLTPLVIKKYEGDEADGKYHGKGVAVFADSHTYEGQFVKGLMEGTGQYVWVDGVTYRGEFKDNRITGTGTYVWRTGCKYEGQVRNSIRHGKGLYTDGNAIYLGSWKDGNLNGFVEYLIERGALLRGVLKYNAEGTCYYEGEWKDGKKHGKGIMRYASGNIYDGEWTEDVKHGKGTMIWVQRGEEYTGEWKDGVLNGYGAYTWRVNADKLHQFPMHNRYEGCWLNGKRHGHGVYQYATGARYEGAWKDDVKSGIGTYISENGRRYVGRWVNDRMVDKHDRFDNGLPFYFNIAFFFNANDKFGQSQQLKNVNNVLLRHIGMLRQLYQKYCNVERFIPPAPAAATAHSIIASTATPVDIQTFVQTQDGNGVSSHVMSRLQLWVLLKDCKFMSNQGVPLAELDRAIAQYFRDDSQCRQRYADPHNTQEPFILQHFLEALMCVARHLYGSTAQTLSAHEDGIAAALSHMLKHDIIPHAVHETTPEFVAEHGQWQAYRLEQQPQLSTQSTPPQQRQQHQPAKLTAFLNSVYKDMRLIFQQRTFSVYDKISRRTMQSLPGAANDKTITIRDFLLFLKECRQLDISKGTLTVSKVLGYFANENRKVLQESSVYNLEYELVCWDFFEALYACALIKNEERIYKIIRPCLSGAPGERPQVSLELLQERDTEDEIREDTNVNASNKDSDTLLTPATLGPTQPSQTSSMHSPTKKKDQDSKGRDTKDDKKTGGAGKGSKERDVVGAEKEKAVKKGDKSKVAALKEKEISSSKEKMKGGAAGAPEGAQLDANSSMSTSNLADQNTLKELQLLEARRVEMLEKIDWNHVLESTKVKVRESMRKFFENVLNGPTYINGAPGTGVIPLSASTRHASGASTSAVLPLAARSQSGFIEPPAENPPGSAGSTGSGTLRRGQLEKHPSRSSKATS